tara:strand:+ start:42 stop:239 length:198 start_codon:yes stop_codon:yes gene_type:complete
MKQYFNFVKSDDEMDDLYVLIADNDICIQVVPYGSPLEQFLVYNNCEMVGATASLKDAMMIAVAT